MSQRIEHYGFIGDLHTGALVGLDGSIDWLCLPRFDSPACFSALLGTPEHGRWVIAPKGGVTRTTRRYRGDSLVLETTFHTDDGVVALIDFMPIRPAGQAWVTLARQVRGVSGRVRMEMDLSLRFDYGMTVPWVVHGGRGLTAVAGPNGVEVASPVALKGEDFHTGATLDVAAGEEVPFSLTWHESYTPAPDALDVSRALVETETWWAEWMKRCRAPRGNEEAVHRSLVTLKGLTYQPTGGILAAPTTSLPEKLGGIRNWDYRYCWLRDATFALYALLVSGYTAEAADWREWLLRAVAGKPSDLQIMYGLGGERFLPEFELAGLPGYENSLPVRVGNAAHEQFQLDVYGEVTDVLHLGREAGVEWGRQTWTVQRALLDYIETAWEQPDDGIWEVRGDRRHFTHSKVMAWVAVDRALEAVERWGLEGPVGEWRALRTRIHAEICDRGYDPERNTFVEAYGSGELDASLLRLPLVGFLPATDPRIVGTVEAIQRELAVDGLIMRYRPDRTLDGLPAGEGVFLPCSFWLVDNLVLMGRRHEALALFERLLSLRNDLGLISEEYDPVAKRQLGNFPQALSHVGIINAAHNLATTRGPAHSRSRRMTAGVSMATGAEEGMKP